MKLASAATARSATATPANTSGSRGDSLNSRGFTHLLTSSATAPPRATPAIAGVMPSRSTSPTTWRVSAPSAMRTPISCVRCATL